MKPSDAAALLTKAASFDQRTISEFDAVAWAEALGDIDLELAAEAITDHARHGEGRVNPKYILDYVRMIHRRRMQDAGPPDYPNGLTQFEERDYRDLWLAAVKRGATAAEATTGTDQALHIDRGQLTQAPVAKAIEDFTNRRWAS